MLNLRHKQVVIIGAGTIATRKIAKLRETGCHVRVIAPQICEDIINDPLVETIQALYDKKFIADAQLIFACTNDKLVNQTVVNDASKWQWVNDCSRQENSDFYNMATVVEDGITISISTEGRSPSQSKQLKNELISFLQEKKQLP
ncbi:Precorrin-2 dehydrogenase [compost metagenome]